MSNNSLSLDLQEANRQRFVTEAIEGDYRFQGPARRFVQQVVPAAEFGDDRLLTKLRTGHLIEIVDFLGASALLDGGPRIPKDELDGIELHLAGASDIEAAGLLGSARRIAKLPRDREAIIDRLTLDKPRLTVSQNDRIRQQRNRLSHRFLERAVTGGGVALDPRAQVIDQVSQIFEYVGKRDAELAGSLLHYFFDSDTSVIEPLHVEAEAHIALLRGRLDGYLVLSQTGKDVRESPSIESVALLTQLLGSTNGKVQPRSRAELTSIEGDSFEMVSSMSGDNSLLIAQGLWWLYHKPIPPAGE